MVFDGDLPSGMSDWGYAKVCVYCVGPEYVSYGSNERGKAFFKMISWAATVVGVAV